MFSLFKSPSVRDAVLGELTRSRGLWRGFVVLEGAGSVPLALAGTRGEPDPRAVAEARGLVQSLPALRATIARALFEHYEPYAGSDDGVPVIAAPEDVWPHARPVFLAVVPFDGDLASEIGYAVAWDEEHTLGVRLRAGCFLELCGSVLAP